MQTHFQKLVVGVVITAFAAFGADNSLGTWKLNMDKSKFSPAPPLKSFTVTREAADNGVKVSQTGERPDGTAVNGGYTVQYDGKDYPATGAPYDTIAVTQVDANTFQIKLKNSSNKYRSTATSVISSDGRTMTTTVNGTDGTGTPISYTMVYDKQ